MKLTCVDLFSGIGGFALAGDWTGRIQTVQFVEFNPYKQNVLKSRFPGVPIHDDIRSYDAKPLRGTVDIVCGGFPCQDISVAGKGIGIDGERSGLWSEMFRVINECHPRWVLAENSPAIRTRGIDRVLGDLESIGYTAWPHVVSASDIGATHRRQRCWIVAYSGKKQGGVCGSDASAGDLQPRERRIDSGEARRRSTALANSDSDRQSQPQGTDTKQRRRIVNSGSELANAKSEGLSGPSISCVNGAKYSGPADISGNICDWQTPFPPAKFDFDAWATIATVDPACMPSSERDICDMANGVSARLVRRRRRHQLEALGDAIVPQVAYLWFRSILQIDDMINNADRAKRN